MIRKIVVVCCILQAVFIHVAWGSGKESFRQGWVALNQNDRTEARRLFNLAVSDAESKADGLLGLCLLDWSENRLDAAFKDFQQFYGSTDTPYPYLYALSSLPFINFTDFLLPSQEQVAFFEKIVADPKANGTLKAMFYSRLGNYYRKMKNPAKANECFGKMGALTNWQVLGTFDNTSGSGFSKDWGAVIRSGSAETFVNKVGAEVKWFTPTCNDVDNWFRFDYYFELNSTIMYAQTYVTSPVQQEVYLRVGTSGSLKVWINDALVASVPEERNCDLDIYPYKVRLNQGANRILVQIGQSEIDAANFLLRLTDAEGTPIPSLVSSATPVDYVKAEKQEAGAMLPFFAEEYFTAKMKEDPSNPLNLYFLAETYLKNDKVYEGTKILKLLEATNPKSSLISTQLVDAYTRANNQTDLDQENEKIKRVDPTSFKAMYLRYNEANDSERFSEAEEITQKCKDLYGANWNTDMWDYFNSTSHKQIQESMKHVKNLYTKYPGNFTFLSGYYKYLKNTDPKSAVVLVEDFCKKYFHDQALALLAGIYIEQGENAKGMEIYRKWVAEMPFAIGFLKHLCGVLSDMQKYKEALKVSDQMLALSPYLADNWEIRAYIFKNLKDDENARDCFRKAIYYNPVSYDSRTQLRLLEKKNELSTYFPKIELNQLLSQAPSAADYPQDKCVLLLNDNQLIVYPEGAKESRRELAVKILNQSGIEDWKEYNIEYNSNSQKLIIDKAEVIKANGNIVKAETNDDNYVVFTNLEVSDVLHLEYRIQDQSNGKLANHFFNNFLFRYSYPCVKSRYCILAPKNKDFQYLVRNGDIKPTVTDVEDMKLYQWEANNTLAIKQEPYMSASVDVSPALFYSSIPDWKYISNWYKDLTFNKFNSDYVLKETVANLLKDQEKATAYEKARIFYQYILENISYSDVSFLHGNFIPQKASRTITTRLGDCKDVSTLFVALCREAGVKANLVLISTRNYGNKTMPLPVVDFNHCIAQLNLDDKVYYLELTDKTLPFSAALINDLNSEMLPIPFSDELFGDKLLLMDMPFRPKNAIDMHMTVALSNNDMQIDQSSVFTAALASAYRNAYRNVGSEEQLKMFNQAISSNFSSSVKLEDLKFVNLDNLNDSLRVSYRMELSNALQDVAGMKIFKMPWTNKIGSLDLVASETRTYPLELWAYLDDDQTSEEITMNLPQGKKFMEIPKDINLDCPNATYSLNFQSRTPGKLIVKRSIRRKSNQVTPQEYPAFRDFLKQVSEADNKQYAIQ